MRDLTTDRPNKTESPISVDAGHFQFETDLLNVTIDRTVDDATQVATQTETYAMNMINLKWGLAHFTDLQLVLEMLTLVRATTGGSTTSNPGFGNTTVRWKFNFFGNDSGETSMGAIPFATFPTSMTILGRHKYVEGGIILPFAMNMPMGWSLGAQAQVQWMKNQDNNAYHTEFINSVTVDHDIYKGLGGYMELWSLASVENGAQWELTGDIGFTWEFVKNWQWDVGVNIGLTPAADDWQPFLGLSAKI
jgi:hypothetical protein